MLIYAVSSNWPHHCLLWNSRYLTVAIVCEVCGPVEADPEYQLIVEANNITVEIDNEISKYGS